MNFVDKKMIFYHHSMLKLYIFVKKSRGALQRENRMVTLDLENWSHKN